MEIKFNARECRTTNHQTIRIDRNKTEFSAHLAECMEANGKYGRYRLQHLLLSTCSLLLLPRIFLDFVDVNRHFSSVPDKEADQQL